MDSNDEAVYSRILELVSEGKTVLNSMRVVSSTQKIIFILSMTIAFVSLIFLLISYIQILYPNWIDMPSSDFEKKLAPLALLFCAATTVYLLQISYTAIQNRFGLNLSQRRLRSAILEAENITN